MTRGIRDFCLWLLILALLASLVGCAQNTPTPSDATESEEVNMKRDATPIPDSDELVQTLAADSMVLLKNENGCLPLPKGTRINLFGYNATEKGFLLTGGGSGSTRTAADKNVTLLKAFEEAGVEVNRALYDAYAGWDTLDLDSNSTDGAPQCVLSNPGADFYTEALLRQAKEFSDTAVVVISRWGRENGKVTADGKTHREIPLVQVKSGMDTDAGRTYLQLSTEEELMLAQVSANFQRVIVLLNTCNTMELGFLDAAGIDAALFIGMPGQSGTRAIPRLLFGDVTPSGRTADVYVYDHQADPTWANLRPDYTDKTNKFVSYQEGIYYGYRWYETAFADGVKLVANGREQDLSTEEGYRRVVQYPFGFGLSYTSFCWELVDSPSKLGASAEYTVKVRVTNTGDLPGKDVVQLYLTAPYTPGGIEKAAVVLVDFAKTDTLRPGESQEVTLTFTDYALASYDCYDANGNGFAGYEVEKGEYCLKLMRNAHQLSEAGVITLQAEQDILFAADPVTGETVENRFTGSTSYGSPVDGGLTYMTRADFAGSFPVAQVNGTKTKTVKPSFRGEVKELRYGEDNGLYLVTRSDGSKASLSDLTGLSTKQLVWNKELLLQLHDYNNEEVWDRFLSQLTKAETEAIIKDGGFKVVGTVSLGVYETVESDGPSGLSRVPEADRTAWPAQSLTACSWNETLLYTQGRAVGREARNADLQGWYAPGANLHRNPYTSRNFEYYSEDPVLSGALAAMVIRGAKNEGLICYLKHFAVSEGGQNPTQVNTWLTEQTLREVYLKSFELAVKGGKANGVMSAFNNIGDVYCGHDQALLEDVLRGEWGFRGAVITDWWGEYMTITHCVLAGNDKMLMKKETGQYADTATAEHANAARRAVKNILYAIVDSCVTGELYDQPLAAKDVLEATDEGGAANAN